MLNPYKYGRQRIEPDNVDASEATSADDIFTKLSNDILKAMFTVIKTKGSNGAPSQPETTRGYSE